MDKHRFNEQFFNEIENGTSQDESIEKIEGYPREATRRKWYSRWYGKAIESARSALKRKENKVI